VNAEHRAAAKKLESVTSRCHSMQTVSLQELRWVKKNARKQRVPGGRRTHTASGAIGRHRCLNGKGRRPCQQLPVTEPVWQPPCRRPRFGVSSSSSKGLCDGIRRLVVCHRVREESNQTRNQRWRREHMRASKFRQCEFEDLSHFVKMTQEFSNKTALAPNFTGFLLLESNSPIYHLTKFIMIR
jgi:hypothetical protein